MNDNSSQSSRIELPEIRIEPVAKWGFPDLRELAHYRDLLFFMVWRTIKVSYAQSIAGIAWAVINPAMQVILFSLVFGGLLEIDSGEVPYPLMVTSGVIVWGYMTAALNGSSNSLVDNAGMLAKVYFPRIIFLLNPVLGNLVPFAVSLALLIPIMLYYQVPLTNQLFMLPVFLLLMILTPLSIGLWLSSLAIRFRDVKIAMSHFMRMLIYIVPVMYPSEQIPAHLREYYILNPLVGVVEGFRACLLGTPIYWDSFINTVVITAVLLVTGAVYFRRMERVIVDVI